MAESYRSRGASADKADVHAAVGGLDPGLFPGAFCKLVPDPAGDPGWAAVLHADGAGTKSLVAYLVHRETGRLDVFEGLAQDAAVMNVDDALCVGATDGFILSNAIARNAHRIDGAVIAAIVRGYRRFADDLGALGVDVTLAGGETADVGDLVQTLVVDSTLFARVRRDQVVDASRVRPGQVIVGLASTGRAAYERGENSGIAANGLTLARHVLLRHDYAERYPETYAPTVAREHVYRGRFRLEDALPGAAMTVGDALLSPTRTYAPIVKTILDGDRGAIGGIVHCTGGGQTKCRRFGRGVHYVKSDPFPVPPVFRAILESGAVPAREMYQVFNMGHRMEVYCDPPVADRVVAAAEKFGVGARVVGEVRRSATERNRVTIVGDGQEFTFEA
ncbi:MAG TPA: AIR synthase related protein [Candidatus Binatia bacterium]|nr:AIR synthase related protein [Candidatus Binatia bacterium]